MEKGQKELGDYEETDKKVIDLFDSLAARLKQRILRAPVRSPETLFEELEALNLVMELKRKLKEP